MARAIVRLFRIVVGFLLAGYFLFRNGSGPVSHMFLRNCARYPIRPTYLHGECVVVVGGSSGLGFELAKELTETFHARVIITSPSQARAEEAGKRLNPAMLLAALPLDLADRAQVIKFAGTVNRVAREVCKEGKLHRLFLNAGMMYGLDYEGPWERPMDHESERVPPNRDYSFAANFLGYADLLQELFPLIQQSDTVVVATTSAASYKGQPNQVFETQLRDRALPPDAVRFLPLSYDTDAFQRLANGKLALNALIFRLQAKGVRASLINPGFVSTRFGRADRSFETGNRTNPYWPIAVPAVTGAQFVLGASFVEPQLSKFRILSSFYLPAYIFPHHMEWLQRYTMDNAYVWGCPVPIGNSVEFTERAREVYFRRI